MRTETHKDLDLYRHWQILRLLRVAFSRPDNSRGNQVYLIVITRESSPPSLHVVLRPYMSFSFVIVWKKWVLVRGSDLRAPFFVEDRSDLTGRPVDGTDLPKVELAPNELPWFLPDSSTSNAS